MNNILEPTLTNPAVNCAYHSYPLASCNLDNISQDSFNHLPGPLLAIELLINLFFFETWSWSCPNWSDWSNRSDHWPFNWAHVSVQWLWPFDFRGSKTQPQLTWTLPFFWTWWCIWLSHIRMLITSPLLAFKHLSAGLRPPAFIHKYWIPKLLGMLRLGLPSPHLADIWTNFFFAAVLGISVFGLLHFWQVYLVSNKIQV